MYRLYLFSKNPKKSFTLLKSHSHFKTILNELVANKDIADADSFSIISPLNKIIYSSYEVNLNLLTNKQSKALKNILNKYYNIEIPFEYYMEPIL